MNTAASVSKTLKTRPNLSTVVPYSPPPEGPEMDTTTPMDTSVMPFTQMLIPKWGPWLLSRLNQHWDFMGPMTWKNHLAQHMGPNDSLLIKAKRAILLVVYNRETFEPRPVANIVFCFKFDPKDASQDADVKLLFDRVEDWAMKLGIQYITVRHPERCDLPYAKVREFLGGEERKVLVKDLDKGLED